MMRSEALDKFNDAVIKKAIALIDKDRMAGELSAIIEEEMSEEFNRMIGRGMDLESWLMYELLNTSTPAGKQFSKALTDITKRMAAAI